MRVALWTPRPRAGWPGVLAPLLGERVELVLVDEEPSPAPDVDLDVYHVADHPAHAFVYHALRRRPGLVVLEEWNLHRLVHGATVGWGDPAAYRREARRAHGPLGSFCARQVLAGRGGRLPSLLILNQCVLESACALVATSRGVHSRAAPRLRERPLVHLPLAFLGLGAPPLREGPSRAGPDAGAPVVLSVQPPRHDGAHEEARAAVDESVRRAVPRATLAHVREEDPALADAIADADVVVALEDPGRAGVGEALPRALAAGRATLVSAGSGAGREAPEGVVVHVTPGPTEAAEVAALVRRLLDDDTLRSTLGGRARAFAAERADPLPAVRAFHDLLVAARPLLDDPRGTSAAGRTAANPVADAALHEIAVAGRELGLWKLPSELAPLVLGVFGRVTR